MEYLGNSRHTDPEKPLTHRLDIEDDELRLLQAIVLSIPGGGPLRALVDQMVPHLNVGLTQPIATETWDSFFILNQWWEFEYNGLHLPENPTFIIEEKED